jgi:hypothetical protein
MIVRRSLLAALVLSFCHSFASGAEPSPPATLMAEPGKLLVDNPLDKVPEPRKGPGDWQVADGALRGSEREADHHGAVLRMPLKQRDVVLSYQFRLDGAKATSLSFNDEREHVCRVMIGPRLFRVQRDDHDHDGPDKAVVFGQQNIPVKPDEWHTLVVELLGPEMVATLDGKHTEFGADELLDRVKDNFGFTVSGDGVSFRKLQVWSATPKSGWDGRKASLKKSPST